MKAIMYHYVRHRRDDLPYFRYLDFDNFCKQLDYFQERYGFAHIEEFESAIQQGTPVTGSKIVLTFDDGLRDHFDFVFPELKRRGLWGIFYVPTLPITGKTLLNVHLIHLLTGSIPAEILIQQMDELIKEHMIPDVKIKEFREATYAHQKNPPSIERFKRTLNFYVDYKYQRDLLIQLLEQNGLKQNTEDYYATAAEIREMSQNGMIIGSHSVSHSILSKLSYNEQKKEISESFSTLEQLAGPLRLKTFCFPHGGFHTFTDETVRILEEEACAFSFNVEPRDISTLDIVEKRQYLPRYDCNKFPHGMAS
jgi:peptidoglycan/xylan/chitin deacetylase (PgdA/CDA1 family)